MIKIDIRFYINAAPDKKVTLTIVNTFYIFLLTCIAAAINLRLHRSKRIPFGTYFYVQYLMQHFAMRFSSPVE